MVLESANCTECRTEIWHNDNYCQECGSRTSFLAQRDTQWRKAPAGPSWNREPVEPSWQKPVEPSFSNPVESSWNQSTEPTPIRSFVQSTFVSQPVPMSEPTTKPIQSAPPPPPLPPPTPVVPEIIAKEPEVKVATPVAPVVSTPVPILMPVSIPVLAPTPKDEPPVVQVSKPAPQPEVNFVSPVMEKFKSAEPAAVKEEETVLKARWTALESPLLRPRMSDEDDDRKQPEEIIHKIKITNILWLCVCFLAGILIYCLFDIVKMTILKPNTDTAKQQIVVPDAKSIETKAIETKPAEIKPVETKPIETKPIDAVPIKAVSVQPVVSVPVAPKPTVKPVAPKLPVKPIAKVPSPPKLVPPTKLPTAAKPKPTPSAVRPEVVQPRASVDPNNPTRTRTVWQAPTSSVAPNPPVRPVVSSKSPVISKGTGGDLARYNRLLADYFSRAGNGSFGDESSEPPTYSEWLSRGKPEF